MQGVEKDGGIEFTVRVVPRSSRSEVVGRLDEMLKVRVTSPPVDGAANAELIKLLAKTFGVARSNVTITGGQNSRTKRVRIAEISRTAFDVICHRL